MIRQRVVPQRPNSGSMRGSLVLGTVVALVAALLLTAPSVAGAATPAKAAGPAQPVAITTTSPTNAAFMVRNMELPLVSGPMAGRRRYTAIW